jgi:hypothetical protein
MVLDTVGAVSFARLLMAFFAGDAAFCTSAAAAGDLVFAALGVVVGDLLALAEALGDDDAALEALGDADAALGDAALGEPAFADALIVFLPAVIGSGTSRGRDAERELRAPQASCIFLFTANNLPAR